jgi:hypothetical protein
LAKGNVNDWGLSSELRIFDCELRRTGLSPPKEIKVEGNRMWLILRRESCREVGQSDLHEDGSNKSAMRY